MADIVIISGSPTETSRSEQVLKFLGSLLEKENLSIIHVSVKDVPAEDLVTGNYLSPVIKNIAQSIEQAKGVIIGTPVYKGAYSGVLKALIDLLPQDVFQHKPVLPLMTGGSSNHLLALEYSLKPLIATLKGINLKGIFIQDDQIDKLSVNPIIDEDVLQRTTKQLYYFKSLVDLSAVHLPV